MLIVDHFAELNKSKNQQERKKGTFHIDKKKTPNLFCLHKSMVMVMDNPWKGVLYAKIIARLSEPS